VSESSVGQGMHVPFDLDADAERKEVFAYFGLAVAKQQVVERLLGFVVLYPQLIQLQTQGERNDAALAVHQLSLGQLCDRIAKMTDDPNATVILKAANKVRRMTVHRFFYEDQRQALLATAEGRRRLTSELRDIAQQFDDIETEIRALGVLEFDYSSNPGIPPIPRFLAGW
jgi:hypothetical protein